MKLLPRLPVGLIGRIVGILLLTVIIEFGVSTFARASFRFGTTRRGASPNISSYRGG